MKYRPVLTEEEVQLIMKALQQYSEDTEEIVALIRKLDLLLYRAQVGSNSKNKKAEPKKSALAAMLAEKYASFNSFQEARQEMEAADIAIALQSKQPAELSKEEINFIGKYIIGGQ